MLIELPFEPDTTLDEIDLVDIEIALEKECSLEDIDDSERKTETEA